MAQVGISLAIGLGVSVLQNLLTPAQNVGKVDDLSPPKSNYGIPIPKVWGTVRLPTNLMWARPLQEHKSSGGGGKGGLFTPKVNRYSYTGDFAVLVCEGPVLAIKRIWLNGKVHYNLGADADPKTIQDSKDFANRYLRIYRGTSDQAADPLMASDTRDAAAYRNRCYLVFEGLPLDDYGNTFPLVSVEVVMAGSVDGQGLVTPLTVPLSRIVSDICLESGLRTDQIDVTAIGSIPVAGYFLNEANSDYKGYLNQLADALFFDCIETAGKLTFRPSRVSTVAATIPFADMRAYESKDSRPKYFEHTRKQDLELPSAVIFKALNPSLNYAEDARIAQRFGTPSSAYVRGRHADLQNIKSVRHQNQKQYTFNVVMTATEIASAAHKKLWIEWIQRSRYKFRLPLQYLYLEAGDVVSIAPHGTPVEVKIAKLDIGANLLLEVEAVGYLGSIYSYRSPILPVFNETVADGGKTGYYQVTRRNLNSILRVTNLAGSIVYTPGTDFDADFQQGKLHRASGGAIGSGDTLQIQYDLEETGAPPASVDLSGTSALKVLDINLIQDTDQDRGVYVAASTVNGQPNNLFYSLDGGANYVLLDAWEDQATTGVCETVLGTTVKVRLDNDNDLASYSANWSRGGLPMALVGSEIIRFRDAVLQSDGTYLLSTLYRYQRGTEGAVHAANEQFCLLDGAVKRLTGSGYSVGQTIYFKNAAGGILGGDVSTLTPVVLTVQGNALKPYGPVNVGGTRDGSANLTIAWTRRDRKRGDATTYAGLPLSESSERYEIDILSTNGTTVLRTLTSTAPSVNYPATTQTTDFGSPQSSVKIKVYQVSGEVGRGYGASATV
jgi:Putative phage tail protein